jgi:hypothetical protein
MILLFIIRLRFFSDDLLCSVPIKPYGINRLLLAQHGR